jgi:hypothetical protein
MRISEGRLPRKWKKAEGGKKGLLSRAEGGRRGALQVYMLA